MKSFIILTAIFAVMVPGTSGIVAAEDCTFEEKIEEMVEQSMDAALILSENVQEKIHERRKGKTDREYERLLTLMQRVQGNVSNYGGQILVIPDEQVNIEQMARITEDMTVMSRILDKKIHPELRTGMVYGGYGGGGYSWHLSRQFFGGTGTKGIYLADYGALFVTKVDFPLLPPVDPNKHEKAGETEDKIWDETKMEIYESEKFHRYMEQQSGPDYDSQKVEALKNELMKALKHAANIRDLNGSGQRVIITVIGNGRSVVHEQGWYASSRMGGYGGYGGKGGSRVVEIPKDVAPRARSVMTISARKADIDRFAKGEIDVEAFRSNVKILIF